MRSTFWKSVGFWPVNFSCFWSSDGVVFRNAVFVAIWKGAKWKMTLTEFKPTFRPILELFSGFSGRFSLKGGGLGVYRILSLYIGSIPYFPTWSGPIFPHGPIFPPGAGGRGEALQSAAPAFGRVLGVSNHCVFGCLWQLSSPRLCRQSNLISNDVLHVPSKLLQKSMSNFVFKINCQKY